MCASPTRISSSIFYQKLIADIESEQMSSRLFDARGSKGAWLRQVKVIRRAVLNLVAGQLSDVRAELSRRAWPTEIKSVHTSEQWVVAPRISYVLSASGYTRILRELARRRFNFAGINRLTTDRVILR